jgi:hypothetical protein
MDEFFETVLSTIRRVGLPQQPTMFAEEMSGKMHIVALVAPNSADVRVFAAAWLESRAIRRFVIASMFHNILGISGEYRADDGVQQVVLSYTTPSFACIARKDKDFTREPLLK